MKKILLLILSAIMLFSAVSCETSELKTESKVNCESFAIKFSTSTSSTKALAVTTEDFDFDALKEAGYKSVKITVSYKVSFEKHWGFGNIGYLGNPRYDVSLLNSDGVGESKTALETDTKQKSEKIIKTFTIDEVIDKEFALTFTTTNVQNLITFEDIVVEYSVKK